MVARGHRAGNKAGKWGVAINVHRVSHEVDKNILELVVMAEQSCDILDTTEQSTLKESILQRMNYIAIQKVSSY